MNKQICVFLSPIKRRSDRILFEVSIECYAFLKKRFSLNSLSVAKLLCYEIRRSSVISYLMWMWMWFIINLTHLAKRTYSIWNWSAKKRNRNKTTYTPPSGGRVDRREKPRKTTFVTWRTNQPTKKLTNRPSDRPFEKAMFRVAYSWLSWMYFASHCVECCTVLWIEETLYTLFLVLHVALYMYKYIRSNDWVHQRRIYGEQTWGRR